jgi:hypothetical protein
MRGRLIIWARPGFRFASSGLRDDMTKLPPIDAETRAAIREGLAQADRGEFVPDEIVAESDRRHGIARSDEQVTKVRRRLAERNPKA